MSLQDKRTDSESFFIEKCETQQTYITDSALLLSEWLTKIILLIIVQTEQI